MTLTPFEQELNETLQEAFMGLWMRDPEGNFVQMDDKYNVLRDHLKGNVVDLIDRSIIGKNERTSPNPLGTLPGVYSRNALRASQRQALRGIKK